MPSSGPPDPCPCSFAALLAALNVLSTALYRLIVEGFRRRDCDFGFAAAVLLLQEGHAGNQHVAKHVLKGIGDLDHFIDAPQTPVRLVAMNAIGDFLALAALGTHAPVGFILAALVVGLGAGQMHNRTIAPDFVISRLATGDNAAPFAFSCRTVSCFPVFRVYRSTAAQKRSSATVANGSSLFRLTAHDNLGMPILMGELAGGAFHVPGQ